MRFPFFRNRDSVKNGILISIRRTGDGFHPGLFNEHLPFEIILSATESDPEAIETVMKFYDGYISKLCLRKLYDEYGNVCMVVDADLKNRVQTALLDMLMNFEIVVM